MISMVLTLQVLNFIFGSSDFKEIKIRTRGVFARSTGFLLFYCFSDHNETLLRKIETKETHIVFDNGSYGTARPLRQMDSDTKPFTFGAVH